MTVASSSIRVSELRYKAWGKTRYCSSLELCHMGARWYDPLLARWLSADTIVPSPANPQSLNRYSWVLGNPLRYRDPTRHWEEEP